MFAVSGRTNTVWTPLGAANNHEDHDPSVVSGTGVDGWTAGQIKGWLDGSWLHTETDNRPPYIVRAWIGRVD